MKLTLEQVARWSAAEVVAGGGLGDGHRIFHRFAHACSPAICSSRFAESASTGTILSRLRSSGARVRQWLRAIGSPGSAGRGDQRPLLTTDDPLAALQRLAAAVRRHWGKRVVAITGSAGKTTTKEAVAAVLGTALRRAEVAGQSQ